MAGRRKFCRGEKAPRVETQYHPFEKVGRVVTPNHKPMEERRRDFGQGYARPSKPQKQAASLGLWLSSGAQRDAKT